MTPDEHLSPDTLADLSAGLLDDRDQRAAQTHLQACARCAGDQDALSRIPAVLAASADAGPMPADVVDRLDAALAAGGRTPRAAPGAAVTVTPLTAAGSGPRGMRVLQVAAVLVLVVAGLGLAVTAFLRQGGSQDAETAIDSSADAGGAAESAPKSADPAYPVSASGRNWDGESVVAAVPQLLGGTLARRSLTEDGSADGSAGSSAGPSAEAGSEGSRGTELQGVSPAARLTEGPALTSCLASLERTAATPLAIDVARWEGQPAAVIVLPSDEDPATVDVYVVEPSCPPSTFLLYASAARP